MWDVIIGLIAIALGLVLVFSGLRTFFAALPILGFMLGFLVGGAGVQAIFGDGVFSTLTSWIVGLVLGVIFAVVSYFWWYAGALIAAGSTGAALGTAIVHNAAGWIVTLFAVIGFVLFFVLAMRLALPIYIVLFNTAFVGATVVVAGILLVFDRINRVDLGYGNAAAIINNSWWWTLVVIVLAAVGIASQWKALTTVKLPEEPWSPATPTS
ncbi:MAG TPA: DUF4203 domain-containing protein [Thermomicrobiales bacterium]|nr:DUF4203 domain-containing protein [Thermomicrobiales bacterium]